MLVVGKSYIKLLRLAMFSLLFIKNNANEKLKQCFSFSYSGLPVFLTCARSLLTDQ